MTELKYAWNSMDAPPNNAVTPELTICTFGGSSPVLTGEHTYDQSAGTYGAYVVRWSSLTRPDTVTDYLRIGASPLELEAGAHMCLRIVGTTAAMGGAYVSVCVAKPDDLSGDGALIVPDTTRELLASEAANLPMDTEESDCVQVSFATPRTSDATRRYVVSIRFRGSELNEEEDPTKTVVARIHRVILVRLDDCASAACASSTLFGSSLFPELPSLCLPERDLRRLASGSVLQNRTQVRRIAGADGTAYGHALALRVLGRDLDFYVPGTKACGDLRCVYGTPGSWSHYLDNTTWRFRVNTFKNDLPRNDHGTALTADDRADATYLDAQMHLVLLKFHNRVMDHLANANALCDTHPQVGNAALFEKARKCVRFHWQWALFFDTVYTLAERNTFLSVCESGASVFQCYQPEHVPTLPPTEYTHALRHLPLFMARDTYPLSAPGVWMTDTQTRYYVGGLLPSVAVDMRAIFDPAACPAKALDAYVSRNATLGRSAGAVAPDESPLLDPLLAASGNAPSGFHVAGAVSDAVPMSEVTLGTNDRTGVLGTLSLSVRRLPLLLYLAKEAEVSPTGATDAALRGRRLGPLGSRLLTEVVRGYIYGASENIFVTRTAANKKWRPTLPRRSACKYTMRDLVDWSLGTHPTGHACPTTTTTAADSCDGNGTAATTTAAAT